MDVYGEKVLKELGLPTAIKKIEDLNAFQILKLDPAVDDPKIIHDAAAVQMRKLRPWQKDPYKDFAGKMELAIIRARKQLADPNMRASIRARVQGSPQIAAATKAASAMKHPQGGWTETGAAPTKAQGLPKWLNKLIVLAIVVVVALIVLKMFGGVAGIVESIKKAITPE